MVPTPRHLSGSTGSIFEVSIEDNSSGCRDKRQLLKSCDGMTISREGGGERKVGNVRRGEGGGQREEEGTRGRPCLHFLVHVAQVVRLCVLALLRQTLLDLGPGRHCAPLM